MTWCSEENARSRFVLAISAIHWRFVDRFVGRSVPSRVSRQWLSSMASPFPPVGPGEPGSPPSSVLRRRYDFPRAQSPVAYVFASRALVLLPVFVFAEALPRQRRTALGPGTVVQPASRFRRACTRTHAGYLRFPGDPSCTSVLFQDPGRTGTASPLSALPVLPPVPTLRRLRRHHDFGADPRL